jgi:hypothetical protein
LNRIVIRYRICAIVGIAGAIVASHSLERQFLASRTMRELRRHRAGAGLVAAFGILQLRGDPLAPNPVGGDRLRTLVTPLDDRVSGEHRAEGLVIDLRLDHGERREAAQSTRRFALEEHELFFLEVGEGAIK